MPKAKRRLKNFDFEAEGSHVALVGKQQNGAANGYTTLITKATKDISEEDIRKAMSSEVSQEEDVSQVDETKEDVTKMSEELKEDMIQKSEVEVMIEKAVGELKTDLAKAQETIEAYKAKEQEAQVEARKAALKDAVKDEEKAESLFKSLEGVSDEAFTNAVQALKSLVAATDEGEMFAEKGVDAEQKEPAAKDSATAAYLKKKYSGE